MSFVISTPLFLLGFMGTGKSTLGALLADRLGVPFLDTDDEIVRREGRAIPEIFATDGEPAFRRLEAALVAELLPPPPAAPIPRVVACGGGLALNPDALPVILSRATAVCLEASPGVLADRLSRDPAPRPLLDNRPPSQSLSDRIAELLAIRAPAYARIPLRLDVSSAPLPVLLDRLLAILPRAPSGL